MNKIEDGTTIREHGMIPGRLYCHGRLVKPGVKPTDLTASEQDGSLEKLLEPKKRGMELLAEIAYEVRNRDVQIISLLRKRKQTACINSETDMSRICDLPYNQRGVLPGIYQSIVNKGGTIVIDYLGQVLVHQNSSAKK